VPVRQPGWGGPDYQLRDLRALLESVERTAAVGSWEWIPETNEASWSENLYRLFGLEPGSIDPSPEYVAGVTHADDQARITRVIERIRNGASYQQVDLRILHPTGETRYLRFSLMEGLDDGGPRRVFGTAQDITEQHRSEGEIAAHIAVSEAINEWSSFDEGVPNLLRKLSEAVDCVVAALWLPDGEKLAARVVWRRERSDEVAAFESATWKLRLERGEGLPGRVWMAKESFAAAHVDEIHGFLRTQEAEAAGLQGAIAIPVLREDDVLAVIELYSLSDAAPSERLLRTLAAIGRELGQFFQHRFGDLGRTPLTPRELEILQLGAAGDSAGEIAERLTISPSTVKTHFEHIYAKLRARDRVAAVAKAVREGLIE